MTSGWKQVSLFFALSILLLALVPLLSAVTGASMDFDAVAKSASEQSGVVWTSNLVSVLRLAMVEPALWLLVLGSAVPSLAALIVCATARPSLLLLLLSRFRPIGPGAELPAALRAYAIMFVTIPAVLLVVYGVRSIIPGPTDYALPDGIFGPALITALLMAAFLDQGGVMEELGWRGYAQHAIQTKLLTPLNAALVVGLAWGLWHVPRDVVGGVIERLGLVQYLFMYLPSFVTGTVAVSILAAYFMNRAGGSLIPAIIVHGLTNDAVGLSGKAEMNIALTPYHQLTQAVPILILAAVIAFIAGPQLGLQTQTAESSHTKEE